MRVKCSHCQNDFPQDSLQICEDEGREVYFCCNGCKSVYFLLKENHAQSFYDKLQGSTLTPKLEAQSFSSSYYQSKSFKDKYITTTKEGYSQLTLLIHNIHCSACIWLNETMLNKLDGVIEAHIHYTNHKAQISFDESKLSVSEIVALIERLGYGVSVGEQMDTKSKEEKRDFFIKLTVAIFCSMNIMWLAIAQYSGYFQGITKEYSLLLNIASFILCTPVLFYSGSIFYKSAYSGLKRGFVGMDLLVFSGSLIAYFYSVYACFSGDETYFESVSMILTFVMIGKFLELKSKNSAGEILESLNAQIPQSLRVFREGGVCEIAPQEVEVGERIEVLVGERIVIDGVLESENALLDEVALSGESNPISKSKGELLTSGSINLMQSITYTATKSFEESSLNSLIKLITNATAQKPAIQALANKISARFSQFVLFIALCTFVFYLYTHHPFNEALRVAISVIIIACPCALALATPISSIVGLSRAYQEGILFKQSKFLEILAKVDYLCFDKTGTLTLGSPSVIEEIKFCDYDPALLEALNQKNIHPIAKGILSYLHAPSTLEVEQVFIHAHQGLEVFCEGKRLLGGSLEFLKERGVSVPEMECRGSVFAWSVENELQSVFFLQDSLKPYAKEVISSLQKQGLKMCILSGDSQSEVERIAKELGIEEYYFRYSPIQKAEVIERLRGQGRKIAMIGDGINDVLALSQSEIGISMADRNDLAIASSDVVLLDSNLHSLEKTFSIASKTLKNIKQNIAFSLLYNTTTIPLACLGLIAPIFAALSMSVSSLVVVLNALRLRSMKL